MMRHATCAVALIFVIGFADHSAFAADNPELTALFYTRDGSEPQPKTLKIGRLELDVDIVGGAVQTRAVAAFENPDMRDAVEGDFTLELPFASVVTGYALDVEGKMVDGVLVGQHKGTKAYQAKVRRGLDPGLAEITRANAFRTHVFPILPEKGRTIRLDFVTPLAGQNFVLPLSSSDAVGVLSIHVTVSGQEAPPRLKAPDGVELQWVPTAAGFEARASIAGRPLRGTLEIAPAAKPQTLSLSRHRNGETFFEINDVAPKAGAPALRPKRVRVYWDHSLSRRGDDLPAETAVLIRYLEATSPGIVDLLLFSDKGPELKTFEAPVASAYVEATLKGLDYRGASSLDGVLSAALPMADACLFFSDGNITLDSYRAEHLRCTLFTVSSTAEANRGFLATLAKQSAGAYLDLTTLTVDEALARMAADVPHVAGVTTSDGRNLDYAVLPSEVGRFHIVGQVPTFGDIVADLAGGKFKIYPINRARVRTHDAMGALWAAGRAAELASTDRPDQDGIIAFSRRYSVMAPGTVFVVLENGYDYAEAEIDPPPSLGAEELAHYRKALAEKQTYKKAEQAERFDKVVAEWAELKKWWSTDFSKAPPPLKTVRLGSGGLPSTNFRPRDFATTGALEEIPEDVLITGSLVRGPVGGVPDITIAVEPWNPDRPYLAALNAAGPAFFAVVYKQQEHEYGMLPAFYLDVAEFLFRRGQKSEAVDVLSNAFDLPSADIATLMILAERLMRYGEERRALWLYERIIFLEPELPQPRRNLALALTARADRSTSRAARQKDYVRALDLLNEIVTTPWSFAYNGIELIALTEANRIVPRLARLGAAKLPLDARLIALMDVDLRVVLEWNTDITDMDLWIDEPSGERAIYSHPKTASGGRLSNDMTAGYGPEEYLLNHAPPGTYTVRVNIFATDRLNPNGAITVRAHLYRGYNRANEQEQTFEIELQPTSQEQGERNHLAPSCHGPQKRAIQAMTG